jgi:hypothetical protein
MDTDSAVRAVIAFPLLEPDDKQWIESIRAKHDPEAKRIAAHFALVLPAVLPLRVTEAHVGRVAHATEPIRFVLRRATVAPDTIGSGGHVFLIPEDGRDLIAGLHERLYEGALQPERVIYAARDGGGRNCNRSAARTGGRAECQGAKHPRFDFRNRAGRGDIVRHSARGALFTWPGGVAKM